MDTTLESLTLGSVLGFIGKNVVEANLALQTLLNGHSEVVHGKVVG